MHLLEIEIPREITRTNMLKVAEPRTGLSLAYFVVYVGRLNARQVGILMKWALSSNAP